WPARLTLLVRIVDIVVGGVDLGRAGQRVVAASIRRTEPADVHLTEVELRLTIDDPARDLAPDPARSRDAVRAESGRDAEAADVGRDVRPFSAVLDRHPRDASALDSDPDHPRMRAYLHAAGTCARCER